jgi:hypothetical protein
MLMLIHLLLLQIPKQPLPGPPLIILIMGRPRKQQQQQQQQAKPTTTTTKPAAAPNNNNNNNKRISNRENKLCQCCCRLIRAKNFARHVKSQHPFGYEAKYIACLVPMEHLKAAPQNRVHDVGVQASTSTADLSLSPTLNQLHLGPPVQTLAEAGPELLANYRAITQRILDRARFDCTACGTNQLLADVKDLLYIPQWADTKDHSNGCQASADVLLATYLPDIFNEMNILSVRQLVATTHAVGILLNIECQARNQNIGFYFN